MTTKKRKIRIKPSRRGSFTRAAKKSKMTVQQKARSVLRNPKASAAMKKKAQFAVNAKKWKKRKSKR